MEGSNMTSLLLQVESLPNSSHQVLDSLWIPNPSDPFHGSKLVNFTEIQEDDTGEKSFFSQLDKEDNDNENDSCLQQPGKKRRLNVNQVQFLERSFEVEDKLEPDRKLQLAKEIGLQPRQVAIWFQNRRARYKTKQLEKDYGCLKSSYDNLSNDFDVLFKENDKLKNEVHLLTEQLLAREKSRTMAEPFDSISSFKDESEKPITGVVSLNESSEIPVVKQEGASSTISEVFDSDSSGGSGSGSGSGNQSSFQEGPDGYTHEYEAEPSDFSQDEDDTLSRSLLQPPYFPKLEDVCNDMLGFPIEEDQTTWLWPY